MAQKLPKTILYSDPVNDEFSTMAIQTPVIDGKYHYLRDSFFGRILHVLVFFVVAKPLAFLYLKGKFRHHIIGREKLRPYRGKAFFLYGNHTQIVGDALIPAFLLSPRSIHVIVHPNNTKIPFLGPFIPYLGGLPLPSDFAATRNFLSAIDTLMKRNQSVTIYPEAHLWPYYTQIRPFPNASFRYPVKYGTPAFCFVNTYQKRKNPAKVKIVTYVEGPFFPNPELSDEDARADLRNRVYASMTELSKASDKEMIHYERKPND
jgi:1-acyl-sn-glycerol-3-phosphate acyltransferase